MSKSGFNIGKQYATYFLTFAVAGWYPSDQHHLVELTTLLNL